MLSAVRKNAWLGAAATLLAIGLAPSLQAQTIVPNPYLHTQLVPWAPFVSVAPDPLGSGIAPAWAASPDVDNSPTSGSALVHLNASGSTANAASGIAQCVDFASATSVTFFNYAMAFRVPPATAADGSMSANVEVRLFSAAGCNGFISGGAQGQVLTAAAVTGGSWYTLKDSGFVPMDNPVMAASAQVRGYLRQTGTAPTQSDYPINFDHFVLVLNSTTPVELIHFDVN